MLRILFSLALIISVTAACSNLSKSETTLRRNYLAITQPGISMDESIHLIKTRIKPEGSLLVRENVPCLDRENKNLQKGTHSIKVNLGWYYWGVMETPVYGEWCFNDNKKLMDIIVYKAIDENKGYQ